MASELTLRLHNTLTRTREDFVPLDAANVRMYVCGPTVYDFAHIGNARPAIVFDVLFRLLRHVYGEEHVTYVRNITDVDDKINARAARDFPGLPLNDAIRRVTETTAAQYQKDTFALGCLPPTVQPRATDNIPQMQTIIGKLIASSHAYEAAGIGEVLFDVGSMPDYGNLSGRDLDNNLAGARVEVDAHKRNPADFVLWKRSSDDEPGWDSPWGRGRPGWHIECSAMSERYLGEVFDIHAGGLDLIFPHHENEIAQSRCAHGTETMARYWLHNGFLQVEGQKMSKSLGNFITIHELLETSKVGGRPWLGEVVRLTMLNTQYRNPIDWTQRGLSEAAEKLQTWALTLLNTDAHQEAIMREESGQPAIPHQSVMRALTDDLNTPRAISALDELHDAAKRGDIESQRALMESAEFLGLVKASRLTSYIGGLFLREGARMASPKVQAALDDLRVLSANNATAAVHAITSNLASEGVNVSISADGSISYALVGAADWTHLVEERLAALNAKDFAKADEIRAALLAEGIQLMDSKDPVNGERRTTWEVKR